MTTSSYKKILVFLVLTFAFSSFFYYLSISSVRSGHLPWG